jgi:tetratricopeptide (TPR) repeat protein
MNFQCRTVPGVVAVCIVMSLVLSASMGQASQSFRDGLEAANAGKLDVAIAKWTTVLQHNPKSYAALANRGMAYMKTGYVFKAIMDWNEARERSPMFAYGMYGGLYIPEVSSNATMLNYAQSFELDPDYIPSVIMTAALLCDLGRTDHAAELFRKCIDLTRNPLLKNSLEHWVESIGAP